MKDGRIAIPSNGNGGLEGTRSGHFGHCDVFTLVDVVDGKIKEVTVAQNPEHKEGGCLVPVNILADLKVNALIVGGMGMRPLIGFKNVGIDVWVGSNYAEVGPVVEDFLAGKLSIMEPGQACGGGH